jgi:glycosyltransferase involved in cell wall biosynthesis
MGANGHRFVEEHFTWDKVADEFLRMYRNVIGRS